MVDRLPHTHVHSQGLASRFVNDGELARALSNHLALAKSQRLDPAFTQVPSETVDQMRALGYLD